MPRPNPTFSLSQAEALATHYFGLSGQAVQLPSYDDQNFKLEAEGQPTHVLRIAQAGAPRDVLDLQLAALRHLRDRAPELGTPRVVSGADGEALVRVERSGGEAHWVHALTYVPGNLYAKVRPHGPTLWQSLGRYLGRLDAALADFSHPSLKRAYRWNLTEVLAARMLVALLPADQPVHLVDAALDQFEAEVVPRLWELPHQAIHSDANDYNILVSTPPLALPEVSGLIDFGDLLYSVRIAELAIACAYAMLKQPNPLAVAREVVRGYHAVNPLSEAECAVLAPLIQSRYAMSVCFSAKRSQEDPANAYATISEADVWQAMRAFESVPTELSHYTFRETCGYPPVPHAEAVIRWLDDHAETYAPIVDPDPGEVARCVLDLSVSSPMLAMLGGSTDPARAARAIDDALYEAGATLGIGRYDEPRLVYTSPHFTSADGERRSIHLGLDLFLPAETPVHAPIDGTVHSFADNSLSLDYGPTIILEHSPEPGVHFYTLYGHLSRASLDGLQVGDRFAAGARLGTLGDVAENGGWVPHLHFQIITDLLGHRGDFPGVALPSMRDVARSLSPNPCALAGIPAREGTTQRVEASAIEAARAEWLSPSLSTSYQKHLHIVMGRGAYLYDADGRAYLDAVNNVCHVGHCHPVVVRAAQQQMAVLNTNTRYLHATITNYAERLLATFPDPLNVCFFVNSGSEANDLALRLAEAATGSQHVITVDGAYHGHLKSLIDISPYKHDGPGGSGTPQHVRKTRMPDPYRGGTTDVAVASVQAAVEDLLADGAKPGAFICESILSCGGQIVLPEGFLAGAYAAVRAAGGICIADEVQVGFGRVGEAFWGFELQAVVPDIVTMAKPIGNGHPIGAVVTTRAIADAFANGMEYFNTYGGNPVACAVGMAVLDVIEAEGLQAHAQRVGAFLLDAFRDLQSDFPLIGDVRGVGLFLGLELVLDRSTKAPAAAHARYLVERMRDHGILLSTDGPLHNVIKMKPPLAFGMLEAERLVNTLRTVLGEVCSLRSRMKERRNGGKEDRGL